MKSKSSQEVADEFAELFRKFGLPSKIRCDNGGPFASTANAHGLTRLSAWWRTLGIRLERIKLGHPEQNGSHERMHLDVAREIEGSPGRDISEETERLELWRQEYNAVRPHEALGMKTPGSVYRRSGRRAENVKEYKYSLPLEIRSVRKDGTVRINSKYFFVSEALAHQKVGIERVKCNLFRVWFCDLDVAEIEG